MCSLVQLTFSSRTTTNELLMFRCLAMPSAKWSLLRSVFVLFLLIVYVFCFCFKIDMALIAKQAETVDKGSMSRVDFFRYLSKFPRDLMFTLVGISGKKQRKNQLTLEKKNRRRLSNHLNGKSTQLTRYCFNAIL